MDLADWTLKGPAKHLLTRREVCVFLNISTTTLDLMIRNGEFPCGQLVGSRLTWTGADLAAFLQLRGRLHRDAPQAAARPPKTDRNRTE